MGSTDVLITGGDDGMGDAPWFKVWSKDALASLDLAHLNDHEERVWWRLLMVGNESTPRWTITTPTDVLARMCMSTPAKLRAALGKLHSLGMVEHGDGYVRICNAERYQDNPATVRQRRKRERDKPRDMSRDMSPQMSRQRTEARSQRPEETAAAVSRDGPDLEACDVGFRERYGELVTAYGGNIDRRLADEFQQIADDWRDPEAIRAAIRECQRENKRPYPSNVRAHLPSLKKPKGETIHNPWSD